MLGIPTRSDVLNPEYRQAVREYKLFERAGRFRNIPSDVLLHNHIVCALRQSGQDTSLWEGIKERGEPAPKATIPYLNPGGVFYAYQQSIENVRSAIKKSGNLLDKRYCLKEKKGKRLETVIDGNLRELLNQELSLLETVLVHAYEKSDQPYGKLHEMWKALNMAEERMSLCHSSELIFPESKVCDMEYHHPEIVPLVEKNREIGNMSDVYLRFDESYVTCKKSESRILSIPADGSFIDVEKHKTDRDGLRNRISLRDFIDDVVRKKGKVVINGVSYYRNPCETFLTEGTQPHREEINILARTVNFGNDRMIPDEWAVQEAQIVKNFRKGRINEWDVLKVYEGFGDTLTDSGKEMLESVACAFEKH